MDRRTFLKGLFIAAMTPASAVRALYEQPEKKLNLPIHLHSMLVQSGCVHVVFYEGTEPLRTGTMVCYSDTPSKVVKPLNYREGFDGSQEFAGIIVPPYCATYKNYVFEY